MHSMNLADSQSFVLLQILHIHRGLAQALESHLSLSIILPSAFWELLVLGTIIFAPHYSPQHTEDILAVGIIRAEHTPHSGFSSCSYSVSSRVGDSPSAKNTVPSTCVWWPAGATELPSAFQSVLAYLVSAIPFLLPADTPELSPHCVLRTLRCLGEEICPLLFPSHGESTFALPPPSSAQASFYVLVSSWAFFSLDGSSPKPMPHSSLV